MLNIAYAEGRLKAARDLGVKISAVPAQPPPIFKTLVQQPTMNEMPNFGQGLLKQPNHFGPLLGAKR